MAINSSFDLKEDHSHMATPAQIHANRANAARSTGPPDGGGQGAYLLQRPAGTAAGARPTQRGRFRFVTIFLGACFESRILPRETHA
jgi:hypothetical protein